MQQLNLKPTHKLVKSYYETLGNYGQLNIDHEMAVRSAFQNLLAGCGHQFNWTLVPEYQFHRAKLSPVRVDGALIDSFHLERGFWEAKDQHDDLDKEIRAKLDKGYPRNNIIFQAPKRAVLYQHGVRQGLNEDIRESANLVELLKGFFAYREPHYEEWDAAVADFKGYIPQIAAAVKEKIENQRRTNPAFVQRFDDFYALCRQSINPNLSVEAVETMLIQHLLTERIFRRIFDNADFTRRNVIAVEIEKIIDSMTAREFSRDSFLKDLDRFYKAIESAAENTETYKQKQDFINSVYQRFFQGYSPKEADTHGIVYTPQPIVNFMVRSVEDILKKEFGRSLSDKDVHILDPFVGTGNFITRVMKEIKTSALPYKYENELHCNEVTLLPYYVASMNIEHEYLERSGEYKAFPGICLVDTFELAEPEQSKLSFMSEENTARVKRQKQSPIFVIIANPPYNTQQVNENDENKNRKYPVMDARIASTYAADSEASLKSKLSDVYVKAFRLASDRIGNSGIVAFVTNNTFIDGKAFDGMRENLLRDFDTIYHLNFKGNARTSGERRKREGGNIFLDQIRVSVGITLLVRNPAIRTEGRGVVNIWSVNDYLDVASKIDALEKFGGSYDVPYVRVSPQGGESWFTSGQMSDVSDLTPLGIKSEKKTQYPASIFRLFSLGVATNRDPWAYSSRHSDLEALLARTASHFAVEKDRWNRCADKKTFEWNNDDAFIKWTDRLKQALSKTGDLVIVQSRIQVAMYRPFDKRYLYFDHLLNQRRYQQHRFWPDGKVNRLISVNSTPASSSFYCLCVDVIPDLHLTGDSQCFPFYTYDENGSNRRENITDWALNEFRTHYSDTNITKWDIFHYVYAVLHHPEYRDRYAANLKRELPRIPFVSATADPSTLPPKGRVGNEVSPEGETNVAQGVSPGSNWINEPESLQGRHITADPSTSPEAGSARDDKSVFWQFARAGTKLAKLHVNYEQQPEYPLEHVEKGQLNWRVEKMRLGKDKTSLIYNAFLTLRGIPPETYEYRLGNRSALEWVIDQYQVSTDKRSGITNDPNRADDPEYIVRLIGQVITVSLETMKLVKSLPPLALNPLPTNQQRRLGA